jgi:hypothetical protein
MKAITLIFILLLAFGCKQKNCPLNSEEKDRFHFSISKVKEFGVSDTLSLHSFYFSVQYLEKVSGIESEAYWGDIWGYPTEKAKMQDIKKWENWYNERCN